MESSYSEHSEKPEFWFNLKTLQVEVGPKSASRDRVGPFENADDAARALQTLSARAKAWAESEDSER